MEFRPLPIGVDDFEKVINQGYYYVDKTLLIKELLDKKGEVNLFTRPRRFGKTLNMSMLKAFFEMAENPRRDIFQGLSIMKQDKRYLEEMGLYPVINLSLKSSRQPDFDICYQKIIETIQEEFRRHKEVLRIGSIDEALKERYRYLMYGKAGMAEYTGSLRFLCEILYQCYNKKTIILVDEYDVPLEQAYFCGFYEQMAGFVRSLFEEALKSNAYLEFAVITGCLRVTKESIFTGLNNLKMNSILNANYDEYFGFLEKEVEEMAGFYGLESQEICILKEWYDGYQFGSAEVYNPWSVLNHIEAVYVDKQYALPSPHWANTSSNNIIRKLVEHADLSTKEELERLIEGKTIEKPIHEDITYDDIDKSDDNLWNFLFFTGYLKMCSRRLIGETMYVTLAIPNMEVRYIYKNKILSWFHEKIKEKDLTSLYQAILGGKTEDFQQELNAILRETISFYDNREAFYHGFLLGLLERIDDYAISSNQESGDGRYDIRLKSPYIEKPVFIFELKVADTYKGMNVKADAALEQIRKMHYGAELEQEGYESIVYYGIGFYKKNCLVKRDRLCSN